MYTCDICSKEYEDGKKFRGHRSSHFRGDAYKTNRRKNGISERNINLQGKHVCKYCNTEFDHGYMLGGHISSCNMRPDYNQRLTDKILKSQSTKGVIDLNKPCIKCGSIGTTYKMGRLCENCRLHAYPTYYAECLFRFNIYKYSELFDLGIVTLHGWYSPQKNTKGVSRDHIFSASKAFQLNVDPVLIRHPCNCQLMLHHDNAMKNIRCDITIEQLKENIEKFTVRYGSVV